MLNTTFLVQPCPSNLKLDQACLQINSAITHQVDLWHQYNDCYLCEVEHWAKIPANGSMALLVDTASSSYFYFTKDKAQYCNTTENFQEYGIYGWNITEGSCSAVWPIKPPTTHFYLPLVVALLVYGIGTILVCLASCVYRQGWSARVWLLNVTFSELENRVATSTSWQSYKTSSARFRLNAVKASIGGDLGPPQTREISPTVSRMGSTRRQVNTRIQSLDTFRGICIAMMIFVNYGGGEYKFFHHAPWNGMTIADVIFPWFLWVMGMSLVLSLRSQLRSDRSRFSVWLTAMRRSFMLIVLGLLLNSFGHLHNDLSVFRYCGVLQRLGACYLIIATVETIFMNLQISPQYSLLSDLEDGWPQWTCALGLAAVWMMITFFVDIPHCGSGYLGPGGMHTYGKFMNCTGGAAGYLDRLIFHPNHMYRHPTCKKLYQTIQPYDPEGLLGTLTAAVLVHLGVQASRTMLCYDSSKSRISRWIVWGIVTTMIGGMLCGFHKETGHIPINKNLFSLSFVLVTGGLAYLLFAFLYSIIDYWNWWSGSPFNYAGMNSILLYVGHEITRNMFPWSWQPYYGTHGEHLFMNLWGASLWIIIAYVLYRRKIFLSI